MIWVDSHCHLDAVEGPLDEVIARARKCGVGHIVTIGTDLPSSERALEIASQFGLVATVGVHPHDAFSFDEEALAVLDRLSGGNEVCGIGETGLDYFRDLSPRPAQREAFISHILLAKKLGKALVVHVRDAFEDVFSILESEGPPERLVFHCFSGGPGEALRALELGGMLSFAGNISYKNAEELREAARHVPLDRILVETDSPFLAPVPHRGRPNEPSFVTEVGAALAEATGRSVEEVADFTTQSARRVFGLENIRSLD